MSQKLTGKQYQQFQTALLEAYVYNSLQRMLRFRLDRRLDLITAPGPFDQVVFELIGVAEREGWTYDLLRAARESNPGNPTLMAFANLLGAAPEGTPGRSGLEKIIRDTNAFLDVANWREKLGTIEGRVCRVEIDGDPYGTGFLLGSDVVMTNFHVVESLIGDNAFQDPADLVLRFDYKRLKDGTVINQGREFRLVAGDGDWLVDHSPYSQVDLEIDPKSGDPEADELDYALLRIDGSPGDEGLGDSPEPGAPPRGWLEIPGQAPKFQAGTPIFIVQHPKGAPLKLSLATDGVIGLKGAGRRVRYNTNTEPGSSGSPVFDQNWNLVALHHSGDPTSLMPTYNEGIPIHLILAQLKTRGVDGALGAQDEL
ncbi:MAG: effector-associated domain EAD1-containing protein [Anaerolineae bacterium]|jgi:hypothetical protein